MVGKDLEDLARACTTENLITLLKTYGDASAGNGKGVDFILDGVEKTRNTSLRSEKRELVSDFIWKKGIFAEPQKVAPDLAKEFRATQTRARQDINDLRETLEQLVDGRQSDRTTLVQAVANLRIVSDERARDRRELDILSDQAQHDRKTVQKLVDEAQDDREVVQGLVETVKELVDTVKENRAVIAGLKTRVETLSKEVKAFNDAAAEESAEKIRQAEAKESNVKHVIKNFNRL